MGKGFKKSEPEWKRQQKIGQRAKKSAAIHAESSKNQQSAGKAAKAVGDQRYMNKLFMSLSAKDTEGPPALDDDELDKLTEAARERHLFLHQKAVEAYHEEKARKKAQAWKLLHKQDKYGAMSVAEIIQEDPIAITAFRPSKTFSNINGLGAYSCSWNHNGTMLATGGHDRSISLWRPNAVRDMPARKLKVRWRAQPSILWYYIILYVYIYIYIYIYFFFSP